MQLQTVNTEMISFIGYTPNNELLVVRTPAGPRSAQNADPMVYVGAAETPLENIFGRTVDRDIPTTERHGLIGACWQKVRVLDGPMELVERRFQLGATKRFQLDGVQLFSLPATHFSFYEDEQRLCVYHVPHEVKFGGSLKQNGAAHTRIILTGIPGPIKEWTQSAEIFASPLGKTQTPRVRVTGVNVIASPISYTLETIYGDLVVSTRKTLRRTVFTRASWLNCTWNGMPVEEFDTNTRLWTIRSAEGDIL
jgi:hypothetical protein